MKEFLRQFFYLLDRQAKKEIPFLIAIFVLSSLLDVIGIGMLGAFLGFLTNPHFFIQKLPSLFSFLQDVSEKKLIIISGILVMTAFILKAVLTLSIQTKLVTFCQSLSVRLKSRLMQSYQNAPYIYHLQKNSANLLAVIQINLGSYISNVLLPTLNLISNSLIATCILTFLLILHPFSTIFLVIMFTLIGLGYDVFSRRKLSVMGKVVAELNGEIMRNINQGLNGLTEIRVLGREKYFLKSIDDISWRFARGTGVLVALQQIPRYLVENTIAVFIIGLSLGGVVFDYSMGTVMAMVGMFAVAGARLLPTVNQLMTTISQIRGAYSNMTLVCEDLMQLDALLQAPTTKLLREGDEKLTFSSIQLNNISFNYPKANHTALKNIVMTINKGQSIGLIGPSGAGKSTLVNLLLGFLEPDQGDLLVDGKPIENMRAWLNNFGYIPQSIFLLDDTLRRNIAMGVEDEKIDANRITSAIKMAQLTDVVQYLPQGVDTHIGENGVRLSGGQRQRVALARAFYHERDIIVMDEATSSLDHETEREVINTIKRLKGNKTLIVIAHRLTTVEHCDVLFRLEKGQITSIGSFEEVVGAVS